MSAGRRRKAGKKVPCSRFQPVTLEPVSRWSRGHDSSVYRSMTLDELDGSVSASERTSQMQAYERSIKPIFSHAFRPEEICINYLSRTIGSNVLEGAAQLGRRAGVVGGLVKGAVGEDGLGVGTLAGTLAFL